MEYLTPTLILLAILGMLIHVLMFVKQGISKNNKFEFKILIKDKMNWVRFILAVLSTLAILLMLDDIASLFGMNIKGHGALLKLVAFTAGYLNHSLIKNILKLFKRKSSESIIDDTKK